MKQKVVINVSMNDQKSRTKALKIVVGFSGVESATLKGDEKSQIEVTGENIDAVELTTSLRKRLRYAEIVTVNEVKKEEEKKEEKKDEPKIQPMIWQYSVPHHQFYGVTDHYSYQYHDNPSCSIM